MTIAFSSEHRRKAAQLSQDRTNRDTLFGGDKAGFGEPAWEMLLALVSAREEGLTHDEITKATRGRVEVADRYLEWLASRDLVLRTGSRVALSGRGSELMKQYLDGLSRETSDAP